MGSPIPHIICFAIVAKGELDSMLGEELLRDVVVLVLANKQDLPKAADSSTITDALKLREHKQKWKVQGELTVPSSPSLSEMCTV